MKRPELKLLHTTAIRLAIQSIVFYGLLLLLVFTALYWVSTSHIDDQVKIDIEDEIINLQQIFNGSKNSLASQEKLISYIDKNQQLDNKIYYFESSAGEKLAGNLFAWPDDIETEFDGKAQGVWVEDEVIPIELNDDDAYWPMALTRFPDGSQLLLARNVEQAQHLLELFEFLIEAMGLAIVFAVFIAVVLGNKILRRIDIISHTANEIMAGDLSQRIPVSHKEDEFDTLSKRLNSMLDRIQQLIKGIREVTDNIAHDLRSPLNRMRSQMEITLLEPRSEEEYQQVLRKNIEEAEGLITTFNALLSIAQTEAGNHRSQWVKINLKQLAIDLMELYRPLAENKNQTLEVINGDDAYINGSRDLLAQSFGNLLENALKYTPKGGHIKLHIRTSDPQVEVIVSDTGPGIPDQEKAHVLDKFVRLDNARQSSGNGLGLSLVAAVASLHKAELELRDANPGLEVVQRFNKL